MRWKMERNENRESYNKFRLSDSKCRFCKRINFTRECEEKKISKLAKEVFEKTKLAVKIKEEREAGKD